LNSITYLLLKSLLRKGDGNYGFIDGQFPVKRYPPPEAFNPDGFDAPAFAHTGGLHEGESGIPGVGKLRVDPNRPSVGEHGEIVFHDEKGGEHLHGIDGVIRKVGQELRAQGINVSAMDVVKAAIDSHNANSPDQLPPPDAPDWRKIVMSDYQKGVDHRRRSNFLPDGRLITTTPNGHHNIGTDALHQYGKFLESYTVPFHKQLGEAMTNAGYQHEMGGKNNNRHKLDIVQLPSIRPADLHHIDHPDGGMMPGAHHIDSGHITGGGSKFSGNIPTHHEGRFASHGVGQDRMFQNIRASDVVHHLPLTYYLPVTHNRSRVNTVDSANNHLWGVMGHDSSLIGTAIAQTLKPGNFKSSMTIDGKEVPLSVLLSSPEGIQTLSENLSRYPAFQQLFGKANEKGSMTRQLGDLYSTHMFDGDDKILQPYLGHSKHDVNAYKSGGTRTLGTNSAAKNVYAMAVASGNHEAGHSAFREAALTPEEIEDYQLSLVNDEAAHANAPAIREVMEELAHAVSVGTGSQNPKRALPSAEEIANIKPMTSTNLIGGMVDQSNADVPEYMMAHYAPAANAPPMTMTNPKGVADAAMASTRGVTPAGGTSSQSPPPAATTTGGGTPPPPPPPPPRQEAAHPALGATAALTGDVASTPTFGRFEQANMTPEQRMRAQFRDAPMEQVRGVMEGAGRPISSDPQMAQRQMQQFQQTVGDPYQRFITQYIKSSDDPVSARDRLVKAVEALQLEDARKDVLVKKSLNPHSIDDVRMMAKQMELAPIDVKTILSTKGDWERITKTYGYSDETVKKVKITFNGGA